MRKALLAGMVVAALLVAGSVQAAPIYAGAYVKITRGVTGAFGTGEYIISPAPGTGTVFDPFVTFCLQLTETVDQSNTFYVKSINTYAEVELPATGGDGTGKDPLSPYTGWIYANYGTAAYGVGWTPTRRAVAVALAIWALENEGGIVLAPGSDEKAVVDAAIAANGTLGQIRALNMLYFGPTGPVAQDFLANPAPEPASMILFGSGLAGLAGMVRRRKR